MSVSSTLQSMSREELERRRVILRKHLAEMRALELERNAALSTLSSALSAQRTVYDRAQISQMPYNPVTYA